MMRHARKVLGSIIFNTGHTFGQRKVFLLIHLIQDLIEYLCTMLSYVKLCTTDKRFTSGEIIDETGCLPHYSPSFVFTLDSVGRS